MIWDEGEIIEEKGGKIELGFFVGVVAKCLKFLVNFLNKLMFLKLITKKRL